MNRFMQVGKQVVVVALVAGAAAFLGASAALNLAKGRSLESKSMYQLVEEPKPCNAGC
jgi:hypothetical protein